MSLDEKLKEVAPKENAAIKFQNNNYQILQGQDDELLEHIIEEHKRQNDNIELIASENFVSEGVLLTAGSVLTNKYAEGYSGKRYYGGCEVIDKVELLAIKRAKSLFNCEHANVQAHCGTSANVAVYNAMLSPGDTILSMDLSHGGHLSHGSPVSVSGQLYNIVHYGVNKETETIDFEQVKQLAIEHKPKMIVAGCSNYSRIIDFKKFREIADLVECYLLVDMAHIAGLVATGLHPNPCKDADFVTSTTHKTLRGPRSGLILCKEEYAKAIDKAVFPATQGGPFMHIIASKAFAFGEALKPEFKVYQTQVVKNAKAMAEEFKQLGYHIVGHTTDNHLLTLSLVGHDITGRELEKLLDEHRITVNKNTIPFDQRSPFVTSGIRIGTPAITTRGFKEEDIIEVARLIDMLIKGGKTNSNEVLTRVASLTNKYPLY